MSNEIRYSAFENITGEFHQIRKVIEIGHIHLIAHCARKRIRHPPVHDEHLSVSVDDILIADAVRVRVLPAYEYTVLIEAAVRQDTAVRGDHISP